MRRSTPSSRRNTRLEFLRENAHLRFRTNTYSAIFRIRHQVSFGIHEYFDQHGYNYFHSPIITASDAEGAGEMFRVSTLDAKNPPLNEAKAKWTSRRTSSVPKAASP
jgi:asparaginyl-tRNA synthetase